MSNTWPGHQPIIMNHEAIGEAEPCGECGMHCEPTEFHPYLACIAVGAGANPVQVRQWLRGTIEDGQEYLDKEDAT